MKDLHRIVELEDLRRIAVFEESEKEAEKEAESAFLGLPH